MINTKRIFTALLLAIMAVTSYAYDFEVDGIYYKLTSYNDAVVTHGDKKYTGSVFIPTDVKWNSRKINVVGIGDQAFKDCEGLTSVILTYKVTLIGEHAFDECHNLVYVDFSHITSIGGYAFFNCWKLKEINLSGSVKNIGPYAFYGCKALREVTLHTLLEKVSNGAFADCEKLRMVRIYGQVESIGDIAFKNCPAISDFYCYADNVPQMGENVFQGSELHKAHLYVPEGKQNEYKKDKTWGEFGKCGFTGDVKRDGLWYNLYEEELLASVINNPDVYGYTIMYDGDIVIPSQITVDGEKYTVVRIEDNAFKRSKCKSISIPNSVAVIGNSAFRYSDLTSLVIPNSVREIGPSMLWGSSSLESLVLPNSLENIPSGMAWGCSNLQSINIPSTVTTIEEQAFTHCKSLKSIIIPSSVISIGKWAFQYCESMTDVYCQAVNVPNTDIAAFDTSPIEKMTLYVPGESMNAYKTTAPWSGFGKFQTLTTGIEKTETAAKPMITTADGQIAVSGLSGNAIIQVLSLDGKLLDSTNATDGIATLNAQPGEVVIVKVGTESYKVVVR